MNGKDEGTYKVICLCLKIKDIPNLWQSELLGKTCSTNAILGVAFFHAKKTYLGCAWMHTSQLQVGKDPLRRSDTSWNMCSSCSYWSPRGYMPYWMMLIPSVLHSKTIDSLTIIHQQGFRTLLTWTWRLKTKRIDELGFRWHSTQDIVSFIDEPPKAAGMRAQVCRS